MSHQREFYPPKRSAPNEVPKKKPFQIHRMDRTKVTVDRGRILREGLTDVVHMKVSETTARIHRIFYIQIQM